MKLNFDHSWKILLTWKTAAYYIVILCIFSVFVISSCREQSQSKPPLGPPPPNISDCNHIELRYSPSKFEYFISKDKHRDFFSSEEVNDVESLIPTVIDDPEIIKALAHDVNQGTFLHYSRKGGRTTIIHFINIIGYRSGEFVTAFIKTNKHVLTGTKEYVYENDVWPSLEKLKSQRLKSKITLFRLRSKCGSKMKLLKSTIIEDPLTQKRQYPDPSKWCDVLLKRYPPGGKEQFKCPSAGDGESHYAMNPDCKSDSPPETVLLFETKADWNQHGGPELFSFDNHDPKGGCVLLNDGTVKFIRTKEELQQLRWE
jgi:hypothetical protein